MDSQETKTENFELPAPAAAPGGEATGVPIQGAEKGPNPEAAATPSASPPSGAAYSMPGSAPAAPADPAMITAASAPLAQTAATSSSGLAAQDADLIEKTWVEKAKQIVAETRGDPHTQNKEINKVKADYIKKRYNKDIKIASE